MFDRVLNTPQVQSRIQFVTVNIQAKSDVYAEPSQTSKMERFVKIINNFSR